MRCLMAILLLVQAVPAQNGRVAPGGAQLPNGWKLTPVGSAVPTEDMLLHMQPSPDARVIVALHSGFNPHGIVVLNAADGKALQRIPLKSSYFGLAWSPDGKRLYVSGGNASGRKPTRAPVYVFGYQDGRLTAQPVATLDHTIAMNQLFWSALAHHPKQPLLYAANRGTGNEPGEIVVFDTVAAAIRDRIGVEVTPYDMEMTPDGATLYVSNWSSDSISVIDTESRQVIRTIRVGDNPNDLQLGPDGRLYVACANENRVYVVDTAKGLVSETISTALYPQAPEGATPNALALDAAGGVLFVANADNNSVAVISVRTPGRSEVLGFIPTGWYPSSLAYLARPSRLFVGNSKGAGAYANIRGPHSPLPPGPEGQGSVKSLMKGTVALVPLANLKNELKAWTKQVYANSPYNDELLVRAKAPAEPTIVPHVVGAASVIRHVIYVIKENRTYDQVFGDIEKGNGDPRLTIFGRRITPNQHALAEQTVLFDNLYCDGETSVDGHSWSNAAYATDFNEKFWPPNYGGHSRAAPAQAFLPGGGHLWDQCARKGLTYRSYGEYAQYSPELKIMQALEGISGLAGHVAPHFRKPGMRDPDNVAEFLRELDEFERHFDSPDASKRLPNFIVMSLPENHTVGTTPGRHTPRAMVASNDYAVGLLVDRLSRSRYWPTTAIFIIEDDAQDGPDHVDARRTVGLVVSPYVKRGIVDSTLYSTSSMLRTIELLLGLQPMSQFDAAATPMYAAFGTRADLTPFPHQKPLIDLNEVNLSSAWGARESLAMDFSAVDRTPMRELNEILWKSVKGPDSPMPAPVHSFFFASRVARAAAGK